MTTKRKKKPRDAAKRRAEPREQTPAEPSRPDTRFSLAGNMGKFSEQALRDTVLDLSTHAPPPPATWGYLAGLESRTQADLLREHADYAVRWAEALVDRVDHPPPSQAQQDAELLAAGLRDLVSEIGAPQETLPAVVLAAARRWGATQIPAAPATTRVGLGVDGLAKRAVHEFAVLSVHGRSYVSAISACGLAQMITFDAAEVVHSVCAVCKSRQAPQAQGSAAAAGGAAD